MRTFDQFMKEHLSSNFEEFTAYLKTSLEEYEQDGNIEAFLLALRRCVDARGGIAILAKETNLNREQLYRTLSSKGNPKLTTLESILHALGFRLSIEPLKKIA